jgi:hypothetical protein
MKHDHEHDRAVFCTADTSAKTISILDRLRASGFSDSRISLVAPEQTGLSGVGVKGASKAPEGAATGAGTGFLLGGALGWMAGIGALAIPGLGPFIAAGPIMAALGGAAAGTAVGGLTGGLVGLGFTEYEAKQYETYLNDGHALISVCVANDAEEASAREIFNDAEADNISVKSIIESSAAR